jgi:hypothetical protein
MILPPTLSLVRVGNICVIARHVPGSNFEAETCRRFSDTCFRSCPQLIQEHFGLRKPTSNQATNSVLYILSSSLLTYQLLNRRSLRLSVTQ